MNGVEGSMLMDFEFLEIEAITEDKISFHKTIPLRRTSSSYTISSSRFSSDSETKQRSDGEEFKVNANPSSCG